MSQRMACGLSGLRVPTGGNTRQRFPTGGPVRTSIGVVRWQTRGLVELPVNPKMGHMRPAQCPGTHTAVHRPGPPSCDRRGGPTGAGPGGLPGQRAYGAHELPGAEQTKPQPGHPFGILEVERVAVPRLLRLPKRRFRVGVPLGGGRQVVGRPLPVVRPPDNGAVPLAFGRHRHCVGVRPVHGQAIWQGRGRWGLPTGAAPTPPNHGRRGHLPLQRALAPPGARLRIDHRAPDWIAGQSPRVDLRPVVRRMLLGREGPQVLPRGVGRRLRGHFDLPSQRIGLGLGQSAEPPHVEGGALVEADGLMPARSVTERVGFHASVGTSRPSAASHVVIQALSLVLPTSTSPHSIWPAASVVRPRTTA